MQNQIVIMMKRASRGGFETKEYHYNFNKINVWIWNEKSNPSHQVYNRRCHQFGCSSSGRQLGKHQWLHLFFLGTPACIPSRNLILQLPTAMLHSSPSRPAQCRRSCSSQWQLWSFYAPSFVSFNDLSLFLLFSFKEEKIGLKLGLLI